MGQEIDQRIVQMRFENSQFENGVRNTLATLGRLKDALKFGASVSGLGDLQYAFDAINVNKLNSALDTINYRFSTLGVAGARVIDNLVDRAMNGIDRVAGQLKSGGYNRALNLARAKFQLKGLDIDWDESLKTGIAADIDKAVSGTAYGLDAAAKAASQLSASGIEIGDSMYTALRGIAGVAGMTNSTYEDIAHIFTGIAGNGRVYANDLMMLAGRGLNATAVLGKALGKTEAEIKDMVSNAQIDFKTFSDAMFNAFGEHAEKANETFEGALSNVKAGLSRIGEKFATPYMENAQKVLAALIPVLKAVNVAIKPLVDETTKIMELISGFASEKLTGLVTKLEDGSYQLTNNFITPIAEGLVNIIESVKGMGKAIGEAFGDIFPESDGNILMNIANKFKDVTAVIRYFFTGAIDESSESVKKFIDTFGSNIPMLEDFKSVIRAIAAIVRTLSDILTALWKNVLKPLATTVLPKILDFLGKIGNKITEFLGYLHDINIFSSITSAFAEPILGSTEKAKAAIEEVGEKTAKVSKSAAKSASAAIKTTEKAQTKSTKRLIENNEELLDIAERVIRGEFGNGEKRRQILEELGYSYEQIQNKVNEINGDPFRYEIPDELAENANSAADAIDNLDDAIQNAGSGMSGRLIQDAALLDEMANKVIRGDYGNGEDVRREALEKEGFNYEQIQNRVNEMYGNDFRYEIPQEVIDEANGALEAQAAANEEAQRKVEETHRALMGGSKPNNPFYQYEDKVKGPLDNLITTAKGLGAGFDIVFQAVKAIYEVIAKPVVLEVVPKVLGMVLERTASLGEKLIKLDEFLKKNNVFENVLKAISAPFKWLYDFIQNFSLTDAFGAIADGAGVAFGAISDLGNSIVGFLKPKLESLKDFKISDLGLPDTKKVAEDFSNFLTSLPGKVSEKFGSIKETVQNSAIGQFFVGLKTDFDNFRKDFPGNLITNLTDLKDKLLAMPFTTVISEWGGAIKDFVLSLPETIGGKFTAIQEKLSGLELGKIFEDAKSAATDFLGDIPGKVSEAFSKVREYLTNIGSISEFFGDAKETVAGFIGEFPGNIVAAFEKIKSYLPNIDIKSTFENAKAAVEDFFSGLAFDPTKIFSKENFNAVIGQIRTWLQEAYEAVKNFFAERAFNPFEGIFDSIDSFLEKPGQAIHDKISSLTEPIEGFSFVTDWISNIFQGLNDLIPYDKIETFSEMFRADPYEAILTLLRSIGSEIEGIATAATDVIGGGILGAISEAGSFFTETNLPILSTIGDWIDEIHQKIDGIIESVRNFFEENAIGQMFDSVINKLIGVVNTVSVFFTGKELFKTVEQAKEIVTEDGGIVVPIEIDPKYEKKVSNTFGSAIATLNENGAIEIVDAAQIGIIDRIIARLKTLFSSFTNLADKADEFFSDPVGNIRQSAEGLFGYIQERVNDLITSFGEHPVVQSISQGANSVISFVTENVGKLLEFFGPDKIKAWYDQSVVKKLLDNPLISLETGITKFVEVAQKIFTAIANSPIKQMAENSVTMFGTFIVDSFTSIKNTFSGKNIKAWYDQSWLKQLVNNPIDTLGDAITSFITKLGNFAEKLENALIDSWPKVQSVVTFIVNTKMSWQISSLIGSIATAIAPAGGINFAVTRILNSVDDLGTNLLQLGLGMMMLASAFNAFNAMGVSPMTLIHIIGGIYIFEKYGPALLGAFTRFGKGIGAIAKGIKRLATGKETKKAAKDAKQAKKAVESSGGIGRKTNFFGLNDLSSTILAVGFGVMLLTSSIKKFTALAVKPGQLAVGILGFAATLAVVAAIPRIVSGVSKVLGKKFDLPETIKSSDSKKGIAGFLDEFSTQVIAIGASMILLSAALKITSTIDETELQRSAIWLGGLFVAITAVMGVYNFALTKMKAANPQNSIGTFSSLAGLAVDIVAVSAAIWIIANSISQFKDYSEDQLKNSGKALVAIGGGVVVLMFVSGLVNRIAGKSQYALGSSLGIAADIISAAAALWLIADVISQFKDYSTDDIDKIKKIFPSLAWFVGAVVTITEITGTISSGLKNGKGSFSMLSGVAVAIIGFTTAFAVIANSLTPLASIDPSKFGQVEELMFSIGALIAGISVVLTWITNAFSKFVSFADFGVTFLALASTVAAIIAIIQFAVEPLAAMGDFDGESIALTIISIGGAIAVAMLGIAKGMEMINGTKKVGSLGNLAKEVDDLKKSFTDFTKPAQDTVKSLEDLKEVGEDITQNFGSLLETKDKGEGLFDYAKTILGDFTDSVEKADDNVIEILTSTDNLSNNLGDIVLTTSEMPEELEALIGSADKVGSVFGDLSETAEDASDNFFDIFDSVEELPGKFDDAVGSISELPPELDNVKESAVKAAESMGLLKGSSDGVPSKFDVIKDKIGGIAEVLGVVFTVVKVAGVAIDWFAGVVEEKVTAATIAIDGVISHLDEASQKAAESTDAILEKHGRNNTDAIRTLLGEEFAIDANSLIPVNSDILEEQYNKLQLNALEGLDLVKGSEEYITAQANAVRDYYIEKLTQVLGSAGSEEEWTNMYQSITLAISDMPIYNAEKFNALDEVLTNLAGDIMNSAADEIRNSAPEMKDAMSEAVGKNGLEGGWRETAKQNSPSKVYIDLANGIIQSITDTINENLENLRNAGKAMAEAINSGYNEALKINSPSKVMAESGKYTISGLMSTIKKGLKQLYDAGKQAGVNFDAGYRDFMGIHSDSDRAIEDMEYTFGGFMHTAADKASDLKDDIIGYAEDIFGKNGLSGKLSDLSESIQNQIAGIGDSVLSTMMEAAGLNDLQDLFVNGVDGDWLKQLEEMSGMDFEELAKGYDFSELGDSGIDSYISSLQKALEDMPEDDVKEYLKALTEIGDSTETVAKKTVELSKEAKKAYPAIAEQVKAVFSYFDFDSINQGHLFDTAFDFSYNSLLKDFGLDPDEAREQAMAMAEQYVTAFNEAGPEVQNELFEGLHDLEPEAAKVYKNVRDEMEKAFKDNKVTDINRDYMQDKAFDWSYDRLMDAGYTEEQARAEAYKIASVYRYQLDRAMLEVTQEAVLDPSNIHFGEFSKAMFEFEDSTDLSGISDYLVTIQQAAEGTTESLTILTDHFNDLDSVSEKALDRVSKKLASNDIFGKKSVKDLSYNDIYDKAYDLMYDDLVNNSGITDANELAGKASEAARQAAAAWLEVKNNTTDDTISYIQALNDYLVKLKTTADDVFILTNPSEGVPEAKKDTGEAPEVAISEPITPPSIQIDEKEIEDVGKNVDKGLADSMIKHKPLTDKAAKKVGSGVTDTIHTESGCASPSWKTALTGMYVILGFVKGLKAFAPLLEDTASDIGDLTINALGKNKVSKNKLSTFSKNLLNPLANVTEKGLEKIANSIVGGTSPLITETKDDLDSLVAASVETATLFSKAYSGAILAKRDDLYKASTKAKDSTLTGLKSNGEAGKAGQGVVDEVIDVVDQNGPEFQATGQGAGEQINSGIQDSVDDVNVSATASVSGVSGENLSVPVAGTVTSTEIGAGVEVPIPVEGEIVVDKPVDTEETPIAPVEGVIHLTDPTAGVPEKVDIEGVIHLTNPSAGVPDSISGGIGKDIVKQIDTEIQNGLSTGPSEAVQTEADNYGTKVSEPIKKAVNAVSEVSDSIGDTAEKVGHITQPAMDAVSSFGESAAMSSRKVKDLATDAKESSGIIAQTFGELDNAVSNVVGTTFGKLDNAVSNVVGTTFGELDNAVNNVVGATLDELSDVYDRILFAPIREMEGITTGMTNIANSIQTLDANCGTAVATLEDGKVKIENVGTALDVIPESATASSDSLSTMATSVSSTTTTYGTWGDAVKAKVTEVGTTIGGIVDTCTQTLAKIGGMTEEVRTVAGSLCTAAITAIGEFQQQFFTAGSNAVIGFVNGARQNTNAAGDVGREIAQTYLNSLNTALDEHSPSRETEKSGINAVLGFVNGVLNNESLVGDSGYAIADSFKTALQTSADLANNILSDDFVMDPTIRPVLDSSAIQNGVGEINSMFGQKSMSFAAQANFAYSRRQQRIAEAEKPVVPINYRDDFKNLSDRIGTLGESLSNFKIVTDTGAIIGEFQAPMNAALGYSSMKRNRGL